MVYWPDQEVGLWLESMAFGDRSSLIVVSDRRTRIRDSWIN